MNPFTIHIQETKNPAILKFETNQFLIRHESFEYHNIEEAKNSPLAQQLFHLPFVKTVFIAQNFIAIEKYNILEWNDVQDEVANNLKDYLNEGKSIFKELQDKPDKNVPVTIYAESTPNPKVMKFVANKKLVISSLEFKNIDDTNNCPLAKQLFQFPFVKEIYMDNNYISINKFDIADWNEITMEIREFIREYLQSGKEVLLDESSPSQITGNSSVEKPKSPAEPIPLDEVSAKVVDILEEYIKPAVANDGGNIVFDSYNADTKTVKVILQGACSGCPSSTATLKNGIETMMRDMLAGSVERVEAVNG